MPGSGNVVLHDSDHTQGAMRDRAETAQRERQQIDQLTRIAEALEVIAVALTGRALPDLTGNGLTKAPAAHEETRP